MGTINWESTIYAFVIGAIVAFSVLILLADEVTEDGLVFYVEEQINEKILSD